MRMLHAVRSVNMLVRMADGEENERFRSRSIDPHAVRIFSGDVDAAIGSDGNVLAVYVHEASARPEVDHMPTLMLMERKSGAGFHF